MSVQIKSKTAVVSKAPYELYMVFTDMSNFVRFLPEEKKADVTADYDSLHAVVQGFNIGVRITDRVPYSRIDFADDGAPFKFLLSMHFDASSDPYKTDYHISLDADFKQLSLFASDNLSNDSAYRRRKEDVLRHLVCQDRCTCEYSVTFSYQKLWNKTSEIGRLDGYYIRNNHLLGVLGCHSADWKVKTLFQIDVV